MTGQNRCAIVVGSVVDIVLKSNQGTRKLTRGTVMKILPKSKSHPHGIIVMLVDGRVGRVKHIIADSNEDTKK